MSNIFGVEGYELNGPRGPNGYMVQRKYSATEGQKTFTLPLPFMQGQLIVFLNGNNQDEVTDYTLGADGKTFSFVKPLRSKDAVKVVCIHSVSDLLDGSIGTAQSVTLTVNGEGSFTLPWITRNKNELVVFLDGIIVTPEEFILEGIGNRLRLLKAPMPGAKLFVMRNRLVSVQGIDPNFNFTQAERDQLLALRDSEKFTPMVFATRAQAVLGVKFAINGRPWEIQADEAYGGRTTLGEVQTGQLVFVDFAPEVVTIDAPAALTTYTGNTPAARVGGPAGGSFYRDDADTTSPSNGVTVFSDAKSRRWKRVRQGPVPGEALGIFADKDCTQGLIKAFEIAANDGVSIDLPPGVLRFDTSLIIPGSPIAGKKGRVSGQGKYNTILEYTGSNLAATLIRQTGTVQTGGGYFELRGLSLSSANKMTGGAAIHFQMAGFNNLDDIALGRQYAGAPKLWDGIFYDETDMQTLSDFEIIVQNAGIIAAGKGAGNVGRPQYDVFATRGKIAGCRIGVHVGGGFDNGYFDHIMCTSNQENVLIDNGRYAFPNQNVVFGPSFVNEHASVNGMRINDLQPAMPSSHIVVYGHIQNNAKGLVVESFPNGNLEVFSPHISANAGDGILIADGSTRITISDVTKIHSNGGFGINSAFGARINRPSVMYGNGAGDVNGVITGYKKRAHGFVNDNAASIDAKGNDAATAHVVALQMAIISSGATGQGVKITGGVNETVTVVNITPSDFVIYPEDGSTFAGAATDVLHSGWARQYFRAGPGTWIKVGEYNPN